MRTAPTTDPESMKVMALEAVIETLRKQLAESQAAREKFEAEAVTLRYVTDFQIGQMLRLGVIDGHPVIYNQALINQYDSVVNAIEQILLEGNIDNASAYYVDVLFKAIFQRKS